MTQPLDSATQLKRGSYPGRWEIYADDGAHIGWVTRNGEESWDAFVAMPNGVGYQVGWSVFPRSAAVNTVARGRQLT